MALKTLAEQEMWDAENIHFNSATGFGSQHLVNGEPVYADSIEIEGDLSGGGDVNAAIMREMEFRVLAGSIPTPKPNGKITIDGTSWYVGSATVVGGELILSLHRYES